ncbi:MAG: HAMP domain-containing protein [Chloroflexi bacterium]|nr:HAMP domain-containing protein [Chloroflexota bacterium]
MKRRFERLRLRWQLTLTHLAVIGLTLVSLVAAIALVGLLWFARNDPTSRQPAIEARALAFAVSDRLDQPELLSRQLTALLYAVQSRDPRIGGGGFAGGPAAFFTNWAAVDYALFVQTDGTIAASSDPERFPAGSRFDPGWSGWPDLLARAASGERDPGRLNAERSPVPLGVSPVVRGGSVRAVAVVGRVPTIRPGPVRIVAGALAFFGIASFVLLLLASVFALAISGIAGYLLARRLARRLESLARVADALASGDLGQRATVGPPDEIGQLGDRFNAMAAQLESTVGALAAEKSRTEAALATKQQLVANVSHELRTPLASIRAHLETILGDDRLEAAEQQRYLAIIDRETKELSRLIGDLFDLSRAEARALPLDLKPMPLGEAIRVATERLSAIARRERKVTLVADEGDALIVEADFDRVVQVLDNLLRNALRHTPEGGLVQVSVGLAGGEALVTVADTGAGIDESELPHVFERFYRGDPARNRSTGGAGLGLAIVRELVEAMGGKVSASSQPGEGSRFSFTLPLIGAATAQSVPR